MTGAPSPGIGHDRGPAMERTAERFFRASAR